MSGHAWSDVELSLVSGNPVTFRQAIYTAHYVERPSVPVAVLGQILPSPDTGTLGQAAYSMARGKGRRRRFGSAEVRVPAPAEHADPYW